MAMKLSKILAGVICSAVLIVGCAWSHPTDTTTAGRRCGLLERWDDCGRAPNCTQARAWHSDNGEFKETFVCIYKHSRKEKKNE